MLLVCMAPAPPYLYDRHSTSLGPVVQVLKGRSGLGQHLKPGEGPAQDLPGPARTYWPVTNTFQEEVESDLMSDQT